MIVAVLITDSSSLNEGVVDPKSDVEREIY
jgi:hypothetical protein